MLYDVAGNTPSSLILTAGSSPRNGTATFVIVRHVPVNITTGMDSGGFINSLRSDTDLAPFAIPASSSSRGDTRFGNDRYWFYKTHPLRAALRGGGIHGAGSAGVSALALDGTPSGSYCGLGFRACKALKALESDVLEDCLL